MRGSTPLAERLAADEYSALMNRFYRSASDVLIRTDAYIDKFVGDEVMAVYLPLFAGEEPARQAVTAARELLTAMGYGSSEAPWLPVGIGVHTGPAFFGTVAGAEGTLSDFTALGDTVNVAARLVSAAQPGEALISVSTLAASGLALDGLELRSLDVKGKSEPVRALVLTAVPAGLPRR